MAGVKFKNFKFKSSGRDSAAFIAKKDLIDDKVLPPLGIKTPLEMSYNENDSLFVMNRDIDQMIQDNFRNLLLTNKGERLGRPDFGASLRNLTFELINSDDFEQIVMNEIQTSVEKYLPYIELDSFNSENFNFVNDSETSIATVNIDINYSVPTLKITNRKISLKLNVGG